MTETNESRRGYMPVAEFAELLGVSEWTLRYRYMKRSGFPPARRVSRQCLLFKRRDVHAWIDSHKVTA